MVNVDAVKRSRPPFFALMSVSRFPVSIPYLYTSKSKGSTIELH